MKQVAIAAGLLASSFVWAAPTATTFSPSKARSLVKRDDPSPYPGGDTTEYTNEPLYLNFDTSNSDSLSRVQAIHYSFGNEFNNLVVEGSSAVTADDQTIFNRFFTDAPDGTSDVEEIFDVLWDFTTYTATPLVATFIFDDNDFLGLCDETIGGNPCTNCDANSVGGYTGVDTEGDDREKTHFCATAFTWEQLHSITCDSLDTYPSIQMENLGRIMLHEFTHYSTVGPDTDIEALIVDALNKDNITAYYPSRAHGLDDPAQDNQPALAEVNADNYAWMATVSQMLSLNQVYSTDSYRRTISSEIPAFLKVRRRQTMATSTIHPTTFQVSLVTLATTAMVTTRAIRVAETAPIRTVPSRDSYSLNACACFPRVGCFTDVSETKGCRSVEMEQLEVMANGVFGTRINDAREDSLTRHGLTIASKITLFMFGEHSQVILPVLLPVSEVRSWAHGSGARS